MKIHGVTRKIVGFALLSVPVWAALIFAATQGVLLDVIIMLSVVTVAVVALLAGIKMLAEDSHE